MNTKKKEDYAELAGMSDIHKAALERAGQSWQEANAKGDQKGMDAAHAAAESIRGLYGYSGGEDGSRYVSTQAAPKMTSKSTPSYINQYQGAINQAANALMNRKAFTYDHNNDPLYQQYADSYTRQGKQAMEDTLAQVSARTGGLASSYAGTAAQQTYNGYMSALADKVPELRQLAYQMYMDEGDTMRQNLSMLQGLENTAYGRYRDSVADNQWQKTYDRGVFEADRQFNYDKAQDDKKWKWDEDGRTHDWNREATQDAQKQVQEHIAAGGKVEELPQELVTASGYSPAQLAAWEKEFSDAKSLAAAQLMEGTGNYSRYKELWGLTDEEVAALGQQFQEQNAPKVTGGGGGTLASAEGDTAGLFDTVPDEAITRIQSITNQDELAMYLDGLEQSGVISQDTADALYATYLPNDKLPDLSKRQWSVVDDGGTNWLWGVDNNAVVRDQYGNSYRLDALVDALVGHGMSSSDAKTYVKNLQKQLGI